MRRVVAPGQDAAEELRTGSATFTPLFLIWTFSTGDQDRCSQQLLGPPPQVAGFP